MADTPVYDGDGLRPGPTITGPAVLQWPFTTLIVGPKQHATLLDAGDVLVELDSS
jgi:N-methylhydantoinase A